jgi:6-pyruvoyltetrahydropterin/6-carboxytetrahydropterin synthase
MHTIFKDFTFAAAHAIRGHTRGCQNLHGHNYRVRVHLGADRLDALGMVLDFADLKAIMREILAPFDHHVINDVPPFDRRNTTAELLSAYFFDEVRARLGGFGDPGKPTDATDASDSSDPSDRGVRVIRIEVWENDSSCAVYEP